jgi:hypothetical protein
MSRITGGSLTILTGVDLLRRSIKIKAKARWRMRLLLLTIVSNVYVVVRIVIFAILNIHY